MVCNRMNLKVAVVLIGITYYGWVALHFVTIISFEIFLQICLLLNLWLCMHIKIIVLSMYFTSSHQHFPVLMCCSFYFSFTRSQSFFMVTFVVPKTCPSFYREWIHFYVQIHLFVIYSLMNKITRKAESFFFIACLFLSIDSCSMYG